MNKRMNESVAGFMNANNGEKPKLIILGHNVVYKSLSEKYMYDKLIITQDGEFTFRGIRVIESIRNDELSLF